MEFLDDDHDPADPRVLFADDVPRVDLRDDDRLAPDLTVGAVDEALGLERIAAKVWYFDPGEEISFHTHPAEEELYYVVSGEFSVKFGPAAEPRYVEVGPGTLFAAKAGEPHGHRCIGDEQGVILALGAPGDAPDEAVDPHGEA